MPRRVPMRAAGVLAVIALGAALPALAQDPDHDVTALGKATQNPVGDMISLPFQFNFNTGGGLEDQTYLNLNVQPVIPIHVTSRVTLIARTIVPISSLPGPGGTRFTGLGDIQEELFFTAAQPGRVIWGVGPVISLPTATAAPLVTGTWAMGPGVVVVKNAGPFVLGGLATQFWPVADEGDAVETDLLVIQPFVNYNFGQGWALSFAPLVTANWNAPDNDRWTVPVGMGIAKTTVFDGQPMSLSAQYYRNVERPDGVADHQLRILLSLLYPQPKTP